MPTPPVSGYVTWLDAADSSTVTSTASSFEWRDKSSNNYKLSSRGSIGNITYTSGTSVNFSPNQYLQLDSTNQSGSAITTPFQGNTALKASGGWMVFIVAAKTGSDGPLYNAMQTVVGTGEPNRSTDDCIFVYGGSGQIAALGTIVANGTSYAAATWQDFANGTPNTYPVVFSQARKALTNIVTFIAPADYSLPGYFALSSPSFGRYFTGTINEILIYPAITSSQRMEVEAYLATKWGLASAFPESYSSLLAPSYTLAYNSQGGSESPSSVTGSTATLPSPGTKASHTFNGWWTSASGAGTLVGAAGASYSITANGTLHARWELTSTLGVGATAVLSATAVGTAVTYTYESQTHYAKTIAVSSSSVAYTAPSASYPGVTVNSIAHTAGSVTHMSIEMSPLVVTAGVPSFSIVLTAYSGGVLPANIMSGTGFTGTLVMNIPGVTGNSIAMQSRPVQGSGSYSPIGTATRTTGDNFSLALTHLSQITPVPPSSGSAAGDPYVSTVTNKIYKLPAFNGAMRLYQGTVNGKQLTVNATTRIDDDKAAMDADNALNNSRLATPVSRNLDMTEAMSFFDRVHVQLGDAHALFSVYDGFQQLSPLPAGWQLHDKGTLANYLSGMDFYAHLAGAVHELSPCPGVTIRLGIVPIRHIRSTVEVAAPNMALGSGALVHRLSRKQMALRKLADLAPLEASKDAPVKRLLRESFVCDKATTHADIAFLG